jgi:hypothetical protein
VDDDCTVFGALPAQRPPVRHAERLLLLALVDFRPSGELTPVNRKDEATCRRLLKRELVVIRLLPTSHPGDRPKMLAARMPAALPLIRD